tara:strand:+ start:6574 stop:7080 length:507 start_codon:yes stop_codon:yes gene_type:complete
MQIVDDFLTRSTFLELVKEIDTHTFPWFYTKSPGEPLQYVNLLYYDHQICGNAYGLEPAMTPKLKRIFQTIAKKLNAICLIRIKVNATPYSDKIEHQAWHRDWTLSTPSKTCVIYLNDNDGYTEFKDGDKVESKSNRAVIFDTNLDHRGTTCTTQERRLVININYFER